MPQTDTRARISYRTNLYPIFLALLTLEIEHLQRDEPVGTALIAYFNLSSTPANDNAAHILIVVGVIFLDAAYIATYLTEDFVGGPTLF